MQPAAARWRTRFGRWVRAYSTRNLSQDLVRQGYSVSQYAIYHWVAGRCDPRPEHARAMVGLSRRRLDLDDIYQRRVEATQPHTTPASCAPASTRTSVALRTTTEGR
jgi:hypothetical protein